MHQTFYLVFAYLSVKSFYHHCCCRSSMQLANRLDIQLRSVVEWQELFHPDAILLRQRYINFIFLLFSIFCLQQFLCMHPLFQWRFGNPFIRCSHTFTPEMPQRLLDISTVLKDFFNQPFYYS